MTHESEELRRCGTGARIRDAEVGAFRLVADVECFEGARSQFLGYDERLTRAMPRPASAALRMTMPLLTRSPAVGRTTRPPPETASRSRGASRGSPGGPPTPRESAALREWRDMGRYEDAATRRELMRDEAPSPTGPWRITASNPPEAIRRTGRRVRGTPRSWCGAADQRWREVQTAEADRGREDCSRIMRAIVLHLR
jgi:hypothetical protein